MEIVELYPDGGNREPKNNKLSPRTILTVSRKLAEEAPIAHFNNRELLWVLVQRLAQSQPRLQLTQEALLRAMAYDLDSFDLPREELNGANGQMREYTYAGITYNPGSRLVRTTFGEIPKPFTPIQSLIFQQLITTPEVIVTHNILADEVFEGDLDRCLQSTKSHVFHIRQILRELYSWDRKAEEPYPAIIAVTGTGYMLTNKYDYNTLKRLP